MFGINDEARKSVELIRLARFNELMLSFDIFNRNHKELITLIQFHNNSHNIELMISSREKYKVDEIHREIIKCLHNYLAAAFTLVDHSRRIHRNIIKDGKIIPNYEKEIEDRFTKNKLHIFLKDLRNYFQHCGIIPTDSNTDLIKAKTSILISIKNISDFEWKKLAKEFIKDNPTIDLEVCIENYYIQVVDFYKWYEIQFNKEHTSELQKLDELNKQTKIIWHFFVSRNLNLLLSTLNNNSSLKSLESIFLDILSPDQWRELDKIPEDPKLRMDYILKILKDEKIGDEKMYQRIIQLFQKLIK
ncbi:MAG: hypothetical protein RO257_00845 [Candidatus Kapabacteria bacterium]|nr:hypothetical protein [Candidatus Kapabacteria bacterium]